MRTFLFVVFNKWTFRPFGLLQHLQKIPSIDFASAEEARTGETSIY